MLRSISTADITPLESSQADVPMMRIPCDIVVVAIGQGIETRHFQEAGLSVKRGTISAMSEPYLSQRRQRPAS